MSDSPLPLTQENLERCWPDIIRDVRVESKMVQALLNSGVRPFVRHGRMVIEGDTEFLVSRLDQLKFRDVLTRSISKHIDLPSPFVAVVRGKDDVYFQEHIKSFINLDLASLALDNEDDLKDNLATSVSINKMKKRHLRILEEREAKLGIHTPSHMVIEIEDYKDEIKLLESTIFSTKEQIIKPRSIKLNEVIEIIERIEAQKADNARESELLNNRIKKVSSIIKNIDDNIKFDEIEKQIQNIKKTSNVKFIRTQLNVLNNEISLIVSQADKIEKDITDNLKIIYDNPIGETLDKTKLSEIDTISRNKIQLLNTTMVKQQNDLSLLEEKASALRQIIDDLTAL